MVALGDVVRVVERVASAGLEVRGEDRGIEGGEDSSEHVGFERIVTAQR